LSDARKKLWVASPYIAIIWNIFEKFLPNIIFGSFFYKDNKQIINISLFLPKIIIKQIFFRIISVFALE
jgi:hypothetical protein